MSVLVEEVEVEGASIDSDYICLNLQQEQWEVDPLPFFVVPSDEVAEESSNELDRDCHEGLAGVPDLVSRPLVLVSV